MAKKRAKKVIIRRHVSKPRTFTAQRAGIRKNGGILDFFRLGESYTSLLLGIVVVIIASFLFINFIRNNDLARMTAANPPKEISSTSTSLKEEQEKLALQNQQSQQDQQVQEELIKEKQQVPTMTKAPPTASPTVTKSPNTPLPTKTIALQPTTSTLQEETRRVQEEEGTYRVKTGEDLWHIAEKYYNDGYKWVEIQKANNLVNPGTIHTGNVLKMPALARATPTVDTGKITYEQAQTQSQARISGNTYTVVLGDTLWDIAVRVYNDGYKWVDIQKANDIQNPDIIHIGNKLTIPR